MKRVVLTHVAVNHPVPPLLHILDQPEYQVKTQAEQLLKRETPTGS